MNNFITDALPVVRSLVYVPPEHRTKLSDTQSTAEWVIFDELQDFAGIDISDRDKYVLIIDVDFEVSCPDGDDERAEELPTLKYTLALVDDCRYPVLEEVH